MKLLNTGDWHSTNKRPENRIDRYWFTFLTKIRFIMEVAKKYKVDYIIQPGDLTDTPALSYEEFCELVDYITCPIITTWGQHDLRFRVKVNTALKALSKACDIQILTSNEILRKDGVAISGCAFNEAVPEPEDDKEFNVLVIHRMIVEDKLWTQQEVTDWASSFIRRNKYDLVVSGDNHQFFISDNNNRYLFNCGSLMRSTIAQIDHQPKVVVFDTDTRKYEVINVPIQPSEKVFQLSKLVEEKERDGKVKAFVSGLSEQKQMNLSFMDILDIYAKENEVDEEIIDIIKENCKDE